MHIPTLETERLILRPFAESDLDAVYQIFSDPEVNTFLPWFPVKTPAEAAAFYHARLCGGPDRYFALCPKTNGFPVGYVTAGGPDSYDLGYGLRKVFWGCGLVTEAARAVILQLQREGAPYVTATHDINNPRSGAVMQRLGMQYQYTYQEQWQPKNFPVFFRLYQLNLNGRQNDVYKKYWNISDIHFVEKSATSAPERTEP